MNKEFDNMIGLTSIPKEYISNSKAIEKLFENNPNIFENVTDYLHLSYNMIEKITKNIMDGTLILTNNNIKLLDSLIEDDVIDILNKYFNYIYLINENNLNSVNSIARDENFIRLLEEKKFEITDNTPYTVAMCSEYLIKQYVDNKVELETILPYSTNWLEYQVESLIQESINKGNTDLSVFFYNHYEKGKIPYFENINLEYTANGISIKTDNIESLMSIFKFPIKINSIFLKDSKAKDDNILYLLQKINQENINLYVENGLSIKSNIDKIYKFIELCGDIGNIELEPFEINEFIKLLDITKKHPGVTLNVKLDDYMEYEEFFLNLNTDININIISIREISILPLKEMRRLNTVFDSLIDEIKNSSLSKYEKYIAAYNIVKSFKKYRLYLSDSIDETISDQSRNPYLILTNQFICCGGYASLLHVLLNKLNIGSHCWILDGSMNSEDYNNSHELTPHARVYVNIVDEKYNIDGYYMCDPTWDYQDKDDRDLYGYKYLNLGCKESHDYRKDSPDYYYFSYDIDVFNDQMFFRTDEFLKKENCLEEIYNVIKDLDPSFYTELLNINNDIDKKEAIKKHFNKKTNRGLYHTTKYNAIISVLEYQNKNKYNDKEKESIYETLYNIEHGIDDQINIGNELDWEDSFDSNDDTADIIIEYSDNQTPDIWEETEDNYINNDVLTNVTIRK